MTETQQRDPSDPEIGLSVVGRILLTKEGVRRE